MSTRSAEEQLGIALAQHAQAERSVLFAGAGVGRRVGLPTWEEFISYLADTCARHDDEDSARLIRVRLRDGFLTRAATVYKTSTRLPDGERLRELAVPFRQTVPASELEKLHPLIRLRFTAVVTTNYDRTLHDAFAQVYGVTALPIENDDTLRAAAFQRESFIARIHGRAEKPDSMVVDHDDYQRLRGDDIYKDFLLDVLKHRPCLFLGFSFVDPAIKHVLDTYRASVGPRFPTLHAALVPARSGKALQEELSSVNIKCLTYDERHDHRELWRAVSRAADAVQVEGRPEIRPAPPTPSIERFLSFAYAQSRTHDAQGPVLEVVVQGLLLDRLAEFSGEGVGGVEKTALVRSAAEVLTVPEEQARQALAEGLSVLERAGHVQVRGDLVYAVNRSEPALETDLKTLANDVADRVRVRHGVQVVESDVVAVRRVLEHVFLVRAWDLAAHFAGGEGGWASDLRETVRRAVSEAARQRRVSAPRELGDAIVDLLGSPDDEQADVLAELGRTAFAVQLILSSPRQALLHEHTLPHRIYFDASILMPAITEGHPARPAYMDTIIRLREAAAQAGNPFDLAVGEQFLEEIVRHREIALEIVSENDFENPEKLERHIQWYGAENTNVFVGAFASYVGRTHRSKDRPSFEEFLRSAAPFDSEASLEAFLSGLDIKTVRMDYSWKHNAEYVRLFNPLKGAYEEGGGWDKATVLIEHEAQQLVRLQLDIDAGRRSLFATGDRQLQRLVGRTEELCHLRGTLFSNLGLIALVDVIVGVRPDRRSLARLVWGMPRGDDERAVRDYLIDRALRVWHDAGAMHAAQDIAEKLAPDVAEALRESDVSPYRAKGADEVARSAKFIDRFETRFFESMRQEMEGKQ